MSNQQEFNICMQRLKNQLNTLNTRKSGINAPTFVSELHSAIKISNLSIRYQLHHGAEFKDMLEPRDQVLQHSFNFEEVFDKQNVCKDGCMFVESTLFKNILEKVKIFLIQALSNVVSIAFKFMCRGELQGREAKQYASKNIMLNVHSIYRQTITAIESNQILNTNA